MDWTYIEKIINNEGTIFCISLNQIFYHSYWRGPAYKKLVKSMKNEQHLGTVLNNNSTTRIPRDVDLILNFILED